jgi:hypothetical protein
VERAVRIADTFLFDAISAKTEQIENGISLGVKETTSASKNLLA